MKAALLLAALLAPSTSFALGGHCAPYAGNEKYTRALSTIAKAMAYAPEELCSLPRLSAIHVTGRIFHDEQGNPIPHVWITLHYGEYSCQYFVREADFVTTRKECYSTW